MQSEAEIRELARKVEEWQEVNGAYNDESAAAMLSILRWILDPRAGGGVENFLRSQDMGG